MWFDGQRQPSTVYVANTSRGKDSTAMLRAIQLMGWPLDYIVSIDIWATQDIPAELPPMVKFKDEYDKKVLDWFGIPVTRLCATKRERERDCPTLNCSTTPQNGDGSKEQSKGSPRSAAVGANTLKKLTYEDIFYRQITPKRERERTCYGFPQVKGNWCTGLKSSAIRAEPFLGATATSSGMSSLRVPLHSPQLVQLNAQVHDRHQATTPYTAPERGAENKYRSLHRHCGR